MPFVECADFNNLKVRVDGLAGLAAAQPALKGNGGNALPADSCVMTCDEVHAAINEAVRESRANSAVTVAPGGVLSGTGQAGSPLELNLGALVDNATLEVQNGKLAVKPGNCRLKVRDETASGTIFETDEVVRMTTAGNVGVHPMPVGKQVLFIQATEGEVSLLQGEGVRLIPPLGGSLVLAGNGAAVTLLVTAENEIRVFGQTKGEA